MLDQVFDSSNAYRLCQIYSQILISNLSRWMLAAARTLDADGAAAGRLPLGRIEFHIELGHCILLAQKVHLHAD